MWKGKMKWNNNAKKDALCLKELLKKRVLCYSHKFAFIPLIHCIILHTIRIALRCLKITFTLSEKMIYEITLYSNLMCF